MDMNQLAGDAGDHIIPLTTTDTINHWKDIGTGCLKNRANTTNVCNVQFPSLIR